MAEAKRAAIYVRLSDDKSSTGENVGDQIRGATAVAEANGLQVVATYNDNNRPASDPEKKPRPEFNRLLEDGNDGQFDVVICRTLDRFYRHPLDLQRVADVFQPRKITVLQEWSGHPLDLSNPQGMMFARIVAAVGIYELELKAQRQRATEDRLLREGKPRPGSSGEFGFNAGMSHHPDQAPLLRDASERVLQGVSIGAIIREWNDAGIKTTRGGTWGYSSMRALLMRWSNAGIRQTTVDKVPVESGPGTWEPIVDMDTFRALRAKLEDPSRIKHKGDVGRKHLLSHILKCGRCGSPLRAGATKTRAGKVYEIYQCGGTKQSCRLAVMKDVAEAKVIRRVASRLSSPTASMLEMTKDERQEATVLHLRLSELQVDEVAIEASKVSTASRLRMLEEVEQERTRVAARLEKLSRRMALSALLLDIAPFKNGESLRDRAKAMNLVLDRFGALDLDRQRVVIRALCSIEVAPADKSIRPTPETAAKRVIITDYDPATGELLEDWDEEAA